MTLCIAELGVQGVSLQADAHSKPQNRHRRTQPNPAHDRKGSYQAFGNCALSPRPAHRYCAESNLPPPHLFREERWLDPWIHNKPLQKATQRDRVPDETKAHLPTLQIK